MKHNTFILKCFLQFTCTNVDGSQKEGVTFQICFRKTGIPRKGGGVPTLEEIMEMYVSKYKSNGISPEL